MHVRLSEVLRCSTSGGKASPRRPIAGVVSSPDNHQSFRIYRATHSYPCSQTQVYTTASVLPLLPGRVPIYRSRFAASHTYPIVGTLHPLEVNLLSGDLGDCSFLFRRKL